MRNILTFKMTIYKPKSSDNKDDAKKLPLNAAVVENSNPVARPLPIATIRVMQARRRRSGLMLMGCVFLLVFLIFLIAALGTYFLYSHTKPYHTESAQVKYYEYRSSANVQEKQRVTLGTFVEQLEYQDGDELHEKLDVPPILESRRSTVVHDFEKNLTAIVDRDNARCFVMPLNRTTVKPPRSFLDLMIKYKTGYYLPDAEVIHDNFRVQLPPVEHIEPFGFYIWYDCRFFDTYRLVHDDRVPAPRAMSKRSADCEMAGESFCLGSSGAEQMMCIEITSCN